MASWRSIFSGCPSPAVIDLTCGGTSGEVVLGERLEAQVDEPDRGLSGFDLSAAAVADDLSVEFGGVLLTGGPATHVTLRVEPGVPVAGVYLQGRLEHPATPVHAALHKGHSISLRSIIDLR